MSRDEILTTLAAFTEDQQQKWMLALGSALTISARDTYVPGSSQETPFD